MAHRPDGRTPRRGRHRPTHPRPTQQPPASLYVITGRATRRKATQAALYPHGTHPDGQYTADLGGLNPPAAAMPSDVLRRFLTQTGIPHTGLAALPLANLVHLWREHTTGKRISIHLDEPASAAQARALLPGPGPGLTVVTTSRHLAWAPGDNAQVINADTT